ncbi:MAG TPA: hypothetical protein VFL76_06440 [Edaphocola sp.]|nr:hypothetical protein [Edaphocola sp.]
MLPRLFQALTGEKSTIKRCRDKILRESLRDASAMIRGTVLAPHKD